MANTGFLPVLLGSDQNVYGMARCFHEKYGISSVAIGKGRLPATADSRIVQVVKVEPNIEDDDVFVSVMTEFYNSHKEKTLILVPCGDNYTKLVSRNCERIKDMYRFAVPEYDLLMKLSLKENFYKMCEEYGFLYPRTAEMTYDTKDNFVPEFGFPVVVKASNSVAYWNCSFKGKKKVFVIQSEEEFKAVVQAIYSSSYRDTLIIQEFIPGDDSAMRVVNAYVGNDGKCRMICMGNVLLEEHTPEGIGSYAAIISGSDEEMEKRLVKFFEEIGYHGFINIDMKKDPRDGQYKLFETNPRQGRSSFFVCAAGYNLAEFLVKDVYESSPHDCVYARNECLWTTVPKGIIYKYVSDKDLVKKAKQLVKQGKCLRQSWYGPDMGLKRTLRFAVGQYHYYEKYKKHFGKRGYND